MVCTLCISGDHSNHVKDTWQDTGDTICSQAEIQICAQPVQLNYIRAQSYDVLCDMLAVMMIAPVSLVLMMSQLISSQAVFSSTEQMGKILKLEKQLVEEMTRHSEELEMALNSIEEYVSQVSEVYINDCEMLKCEYLFYFFAKGIQHLLPRGRVYGGDDQRPLYW